MKEDQVLEYLESLGWRCARDEVGDAYCRIVVGSIQLQIIPCIEPRRDHVRLSFMSSISTTSFSDCVSKILGEYGSGGDHEPIISNSGPTLKLDEVTNEYVFNMVRGIADWAEKVDLEQGLTNYRNLPADSKGAFPVRHLAALADAGNVDKLSGYDSSFSRGDRLGFVPYITSDMISRALDMARERVKGRGSS